MKELNRVMVLKGGSPAMHILGDIGREEDSFIRVGEEHDDYYIGVFEEGFGFINVKFNKADVRPLNQKELEEIRKSFFTITGDFYWKMYIDDEGNVISGEIA